MLKIKNLSKTYKTENKKALNNISLEIKKGEFVGLLGPNGAGKSSLINILAGNTKKNQGTIKIDSFNLDVNELETKKFLGIVPQEISIDHFFTVNEILENNSGYFGIKNNQKYIDELLEALSLKNKKNTIAKNLSGGMKRRLLIARALVHKPKLFILDEPTAGVDIELRHSLYSFLKQLHKNGTTIILTTHYLEEAEELCNRIIIINNGEIIADNSTQNLMKKISNKSILEFEFNFNIKRTDFKFLNLYHPQIIKNKNLQLHVPKNKIGEIFQELNKNKINFNNFHVKQEKLENVFLKLINNK